MKIETYMGIAPSAWASYLINGDASGLDDVERVAVDAWITRYAEGDAPIDCDDAGFRWTHDAWPECPFGGDCDRYIFVRGFPGKVTP